MEPFVHDRFSTESRVLGPFWRRVSQGHIFVPFIGIEGAAAMLGVTGHIQPLELRFVIVHISNRDDTYWPMLHFALARVHQRGTVTRVVIRVDESDGLRVAPLLTECGGTNLTAGARKALWLIEANERTLRAFDSAAQAGYPHRSESVIWSLPADLD